MQKLSAMEITKLIKERIESFNGTISEHHEGEIVSVRDGIISIYGLINVAYHEMLELPGDLYGLVLSLEQDLVAAVVLGPYDRLAEGQKVRSTGRMLQTPVGEALLGRVVNALGCPIDGQGSIATHEFSPIEKESLMEGSLIALVKKKLHLNE